MPVHGIGLRHLHIRKRKYEPFPHPVRWKRVLDRFIYFIAFLGPVMTLPQVYEVLVLKNTAGVSFPTWATYVLTSTFWLIYGIAHKDKPLMLSGFLWVIANSLVVVGVIVYNGI